MICFLIRHGKDDDSVRGGWSDSPLTAEGVNQVEKLSVKILSANIDVSMIYSSDLPRAMQTSEILASALSVRITKVPEFRETNNGVLAGMNNQIAEEQYPGMYWSSLDWEESYPDGESPHQFYNRVSNAWRSFRNSVQYAGPNVILVTHSGVINVIQCIENEIAYSNKSNPFPVGNADMIGIEL